MTTKKTFAAGLAAGTLVGAVAGLMLAPKTGKETRQIVAAKLGELRHKAENRFGCNCNETANGHYSGGAEGSTSKELAA